MMFTSMFFLFLRLISCSGDCAILLSGNREVDVGGKGEGTLLKVLKVRILV